jgi:DNA-directed RNA polymerase specialized sigma24 family protein
MRQAREVLRLKFVGGVPSREIGRRVGVSVGARQFTCRVCFVTCNATMAGAFYRVASRAQARP